MIRAIDLFCGLGGSSWGARLAGVRILAGFDSWDLAIESYKDNFPEARTFHAWLGKLDPKAVARKLGRIDLILASPECTEHSPARGGRRSIHDSRLTAFEVIRFARAIRPRWIVIENVVNMKKWDRYGEFIEKLEALGYKIRQEILDAARFGVPQSRRRLFILCDLERVPSTVLPRDRIERLWARSVIEMNGGYPFSRLRTPDRASATIARANRAIRKLGRRRSFLLVYYGTDGAGGWQRLNSPLRTITTLDRFALVKPSRDGHIMRMLQVPELRAAMGFPNKLKLRRGSRRDRIHLLGNAVCPPVMAAIVRSLKLR